MILYANAIAVSTFTVAKLGGSRYTTSHLEAIFNASRVTSDSAHVKKAVVTAFFLVHGISLYERLSLRSIIVCRQVSRLQM